MFLVISSLTGTTTSLSLNDIPKVENSVSESNIVRKLTNKEIEIAMSTEQYVKDYFKDIPIMIRIAQCESTFRHLDRKGEVHRGRVNKADVGVMQINEYYHLDEASKKDINIYTIEGNMAYARDLYERQGTRPWASSKPCWGKYLAETKLQNQGLAVK